MFLSQKNRAAAKSCETGTVTVYDSGFGVKCEGEARGLRLSCPGGYLWRPKLGQSVLVVKCDDDGQRILAAAAPDEPAGFEAGEVYISTPNAGVHIKNNGHIALSGTVDITGALVVNGVPYRPCTCGLI